MSVDEDGNDIYREFSGWKKGRFAKSAVFSSKKKKADVLKEMWKDFQSAREADKEAVSSAGNITSTKRRITEFSQLARDLWCRECNKPLSLRNFESETQHGLAFDMLVRCLSCQKLVRVLTDKPSSTSWKKPLTFDVNRKLAMGELTYWLRYPQI